MLTDPSPCRKAYEKRKTHPETASPQSPGRQRPSPEGLAGSPGPPAWPQLHWGLRPRWAGPGSKCPLPTSEGPTGTRSPVVPTPADEAERAVPWGLAGGRVGWRWAPQTPAWASSPGSPGLKASVHTGPPRVRGLLTGAAGGLLSPVAHPARPGPD